MLRKFLARIFCKKINEKLPNWQAKTLSFLMYSNRLLKLDTWILYLFIKKINFLQKDSKRVRTWNFPYESYTCTYVYVLDGKFLIYVRRVSPELMKVN